jgi:signal transduction histidine kinase
MNTHMQFRTRISVWFTAIVAMLFVVFAFYLYVFTALHREEEFNRRLVNKAETIGRLLLRVEEIDEELLNVIEKNSAQSLPNEQVLVYDSSYVLLWNSADSVAPPYSHSLLDSAFALDRLYFDFGQQQAVGLTFLHKGEEYLVMARAFDQFGYSKLANLRVLLGVGGGVLLLLVWGISWWFADRAVRPLRTMIRKIDSITLQNLELRLETRHTTDEIGQLAQKFNDMLDRLAEAFANQRSFVSHASHEMRTPLAALRGRIEVALLKQYTEDELRRLLPELLREIEGLNRLTSGLLNLATITDHQQLRHTEPVELDTLIFTVRDALLLDMPDSSIDVTFADDLDLVETPLLTQGDPHLLRLVLINLLDNACKFSGGKPVLVQAGVTDKQCWIEVRDFGPGISPVDLSHIFDPFFRAQRTKNIKGFGIGLSLCQRIVRLHQGELLVNSKLGEGTSFTLRLAASTPELA